MDTPGTVLAAKIIGWLQVAWILVIAFAGLVISAQWGDLGKEVGAVGFMFLLIVACYFGVPLLFLQQGRQNGRLVVIILESLAGLILLAGMVDYGSAVLLPYTASCFTVAGVLCTPSASRWSTPYRSNYVVAPPMTYGPSAFAREPGAVPYAYQHTVPAPFPGPPPMPPAAPTGYPAPPSTQTPPLDEHGNPIPPPPPTTPPGYRWQPPDYRGR